MSFLVKISWKCFNCDEYILSVRGDVLGDPDCTVLTRCGLLLAFRVRIRRIKQKEERQKQSGQMVQSKVKSLNVLRVVQLKCLSVALNYFGFTYGYVAEHEKSSIRYPSRRKTYRLIM